MNEKIAATADISFIKNASRRRRQSQINIKSERECLKGDQSKQENININKSVATAI